MAFLYAQIFVSVHVKHVHIMVIITDDKSGDFYLKGYHIEYLVSFVLSVMRSKHITAINEAIKQVSQHHQKSNIFQLSLI